MTRSVVITGVAGGLGRGLAEAFSSAGWFVIGIDRRLDSSLDHVDRFEHVDLSSSASVADVVSRLQDIEGLSALVNNAALQVNAALVNTTDAEWDEVMQTNVRACFQLIRGFADQLARNQGSVVNIGSVHSIATSDNIAAYAVSKAALSGLTRSAALELGPSGVRCNAVLPGAVDTEMLREGLSRRPHQDGPMGNFEELRARTPLGLIATPAQIAPTVIHLADTAASPYTTGQLLVVDGGATLRLGTE